MRNIIAIFRREMLSFFVSPVAYFVITGFVLLCAYNFFNMLMDYNVFIMQSARNPGFGMQTVNLNEAVVQNFFYTLLVIMIFLLPLLTMRIIAEEKRRGTFELLLTSPLSVGQIVWGKFLALSGVVLIMTTSALVFPLLLAVFGKPGPEILPVLSGYVGLTLFSLGFASLGMACSAFTENQIVAAMVSLVVNFVFFVVHWPARGLTGPAGEILKQLSPVFQIFDLLRGVVTLQAVVYFASLILVGTFIAQRALDAQRWR